MNLRIDTGLRRPPTVVIEVDGEPLRAHPGESLAAALWAAGIRTLRHSPRGGPRGAFCLMGVCQECLVSVDGRRVLACQQPVSAGLSVTTAARHEP